jgi:heat shock protein HslJ
MIKKNIINKKMFITTLMSSIFATTMMAGSTPVKNLNEIKGTWHLRVMDGKEVRKARAIIEFHPSQKMIEGFDGCNRFSGKIKRASQNRFFTKAKSTRMACRQNIHRFVSQRLLVTIQEGFTVTEAKRYGVTGITVKSKSHDMFFKKMGE